MSNAASQPPGHSDLDHRILAVLGGYQEGRAWPTMRTIAGRVGASPRHVRRRLAALESAGLVERVPVFERTDDAEWQRRGGRPSYPGRQTSNTYRLPCPGAPDMGSSNAAGQPPGHAESMSAHKSEGGADGGYQGVDEGTRTPEPIEVPVEPPAALQLDHDPGQAEILGTLAQGFGAVQVEQVYPNALTGSLAAFHQAADRLDRAACWGNGDRCQPGHRCRRHTRRERT